jgi:sphingosine kinase
VDLEEYRGIVAVSGDGLVYEIFNGLGSRADAKEAIKIPIAQIPGGSANAFACSLSYAADEVFRNLTLDEFATAMTFNLIKSKPTPLDIVSIQLCDKTVVQSFLSVQWAIIADVDLESEKYRFLGEMRFTIGAIKRILGIYFYFYFF